MTYPEFLMRFEAMAVRQLLDVGAIQLGNATQESAAIPLAALKDIARV